MDHSATVINVNLKILNLNVNWILFRCVYPTIFKKYSKPNQFKLLGLINILATVHEHIALDRLGWCVVIFTLLACKIKVICTDVMISHMTLNNQKTDWIILKQFMLFQ